VISRTQLRHYQRAARQAWNTPTAQQRRAVLEVREVIESPDASDRQKQTAREVMKDLELAGWTKTHAPT
jgi:hypothetical protein